jgi:hypothetical protein
MSLAPGRGRDDDIDHAWARERKKMIPPTESKDFSL